METTAQPAKQAKLPFSHLRDPEHWRERAKEARALAENMAARMLEVAANYEHLAKRAEERRTGKARKP